MPSVEVVNPFRRHSFDWDDITLIAPGENGLIIGSADDVAEAWCVQKSNFATKRGRFTRADRIAHQLIDILELHDPPLEDEETGLRIRRARPDEHRLLTRLERAASEEPLGHIFPPEDYPYPVNEVTRRWRRVLRDRFAHVHLLELFDAPVGYVAFDDDTVLHLGVVAHQTRRGYGSALIEFACLEIFSSGVGEASLWVLAENEVARAFYRSHGWTDTDGRRQGRVPALSRGDPDEEAQPIGARDEADDRSLPCSVSWDSSTSVRVGQGLLLTIAGLALVPALASTLLRVVPPTDDATAKLASFIAYGVLGYALATICLVAALIRARRRLGLAVVTLLVLLASSGHVVTLAPLFVPDGRPVTGASFTLMTLNLHNGLADSGQVVEHAMNADVVILVETTPAALNALKPLGWDERFPYAVGDVATTSSATPPSTRASRWLPGL